MEIIDCNDYLGWFVGKFNPALVYSEELEIGYKRIPKDTKPDFHYHKYKTEYTILLEGEIYCESISKLIKPISCIKLDPDDKNDQFFTKESLILIINSPSVINDKYIDS